jgi:hypothetical protein
MFSWFYWRRCKKSFFSCHVLSHCCAFCSCQKAFITKQGFRGLSLDSLWSQHIISSYETDDDELTEVALKSSIADIHDTVTGGECGSPFSIGGYGFYAENQYEEQGTTLCEKERENASSDYFLSNDEWNKVDNYLKRVAYYSGQAKFRKVLTGKEFLLISFYLSLFLHLLFASVPFFF